MRPSVAVLVPCYKRPEYTEKCIKALENAQEYKHVSFYLVDDGSCDGTYEILKNSKLNSFVVTRKEPIGLRNVILDFFKDFVLEVGFDYLSKIDNDCIVPPNWLNSILDVFEKSDADILSPNVYPSNAAYRYGKEGNLYRPSKIVGGVWTMKRKMIEDVQFERFSSHGITGAFSLLNQIIVEKEPKIGWLENVTFQDIGHWSGLHEDHIKSKDHEKYSMEVGRNVAWTV